MCVAAAKVVVQPSCRGGCVGAEGSGGSLGRYSIKAENQLYYIVE
jgi:hypothetical protein